LSPIWKAIATRTVMAMTTSTAMAATFSKEMSGATIP